MKEHSPTQFKKWALLYPEPDKDNFKKKKKKEEGEGEGDDHRAMYLTDRDVKILNKY